MAASLYNRKILRDMIVRDMQARQYRLEDRIFVRPHSADLELWIGFPETWSTSDPPVVDVGPIVGLRHVPTEDLYFELAEIRDPNWMGATATFGPHQIDKEKFRSRWHFPLDPTLPSRIAEMTENVDRAAHFLADRYPTSSALLEITATDPLAMECRRPFVLLTLGRTREASAFAEYGLKAIGDRSSRFFQERKRMFDRIIERAREMEQARH